MMLMETYWICVWKNRICTFISEKHSQIMLEKISISHTVPNTKEGEFCFTPFPLSLCSVLCADVIADLPIMMQ